MIEMINTSGVHFLITKQILNTDIRTAWDFLSNPMNLAKITPPEMGFNITSPPEDKMYPGQIITYKISPFKGITLNWVTEITHVADGKLFVDEQRFGPYKFWHHRHILTEHDNGTEMHDIVVYKLPFGPIGSFLNTFSVRKRLLGIFNYRHKVLEEKFG